MNDNDNQTKEEKKTRYFLVCQDVCVILPVKLISAGSRDHVNGLNMSNNTHYGILGGSHAMWTKRDWKREVGGGKVGEKEGLGKRRRLKVNVKLSRTAQNTQTTL